jgi:hypothetical protein
MGGARPLESRGARGQVRCPRCDALNARGAPVCVACGLSLAHQTLADRYVQAPWQLALLSIVTFSLYDLFWFNRTWRMLRSLVPSAAPKPSPLLLTAGLLVPGLNCVLVYGLFRRVRDLQDALTPREQDPSMAPRQAAEAPEPAALMVLYLGLLLCWALPTPWWLAARLAVWPLVLVQQQVNRVVAGALPDVRGARQMAWLELAALGVGVFFSLLLLNSTFGIS